MGIYENLSGINLEPYDGYVNGWEMRQQTKRRNVAVYPSEYFDMLNTDTPLKLWLTELQSLTEVESLSALQAKSVATTPESFEALSIRNTQIAIQQIRNNSSIIIDELDAIIDSLPVSFDGLSYVLTTFQDTYKKIAAVLEICRRKGCDFVANRQLSGQVMNYCDHTLKTMYTFLVNNDFNNSQIEASIRTVKENFGELIDATIKKECQLLVSSLHKRSSHLCVKWSLLALWQLTQKDPYMCRLFIESQNIVEYLLEIATNYANVCRQDVLYIKAAAIRVLTYLCTSHTTIKEILFEITNLKCVSSLIVGEKEECVLKESIGLLVQLTTPCIDSKEKTFNDEIWNGKWLINEIMNCLTDVIRTTSNHQIFLMACAAVANISFMNTETLVKFETLPAIMNACKQNDHLDQILLKDQIVTLLANVSHKHPLDVVSSGGLIFLLDCLHLAVSQDEQALSRIQQKVAVALARLGSHKSTAKIILRLKGVARLVQLCKQPKERNCSDTVLLASIAALKRIAHSIGKTPFIELDALDLIEHKLQHSFQLYSCLKESLV